MRDVVGTKLVWNERDRARVQQVLVDARSPSDFVAILKSVTPYSFVGECQVEEPSKQLIFVLEDDGLYLCCTHPKPHCTVRIAERKTA